jgi:hypothetical protein
MLKARRGTVVSVKLSCQLQPGFHVNSNKPADDFLIPLRLTWEKGVLDAPEVVFPKALSKTFGFSEKPLLVYEGTFEVETRFRVPAGAASGLGLMMGKLRYQACNDRECFPPKTIEVRAPLQVE